MGENTLETYNRKLNRFGKYEPEREPEFKKEDNTEAKFETISEEKPVAKTRSSLGVISLTLGIISVISTVFYYICLPAGIIGLVTGVKAVRKTGSKGGKAGDYKKKSTYIEPEKLAGLSYEERMKLYKDAYKNNSYKRDNYNKNGNYQKDGYKKNNYKVSKNIESTNNDLSE